MSKIFSIKQNDTVLEVIKSEDDELHFSFYHTDSNGVPDSEDFYLTREQLLDILDNG